MVLHLELQPDVDPVEERRGHDVHRRAQLHLIPLRVARGVGRPLVRLHRPVREHDLHVQDARDGVRYEDPQARHEPGRLGGGDGAYP